MTYSLQAVTSWQDVVDQIAVFAAARGWVTTGGGGAGATIQNPTTLMTTAISASADTISLSADLGAMTSDCRSPYLNGAYPSSPSIINPVQVHLFGNNTPYSEPDTSPFIAAVVGFGFNNYRHIYIGTMVKAGSYADGDVVCCNDFSRSYADLSPITAYNRYLFRGYQVHPGQPGGVKITHAENANTWRQFNIGAISVSFLNARYTNLLGTEVYGGNGDGVNDGLTYRAHADYAAGQLLVPINLYCPDGADGVDYRIRPLGHISGARLVDMDGLEPEQQISISADNWRTFPEFSKRSDPFLDWSEIGTTTYWPYESSGMFGLAYRENS